MRLFPSRSLAALMLGASLSALIPEAAAAATPAAEILVDTNRDGVVDTNDRAGKAEWTSERGAILLPNIGDTAHRCPRSSDKSWSDARLEACNDAQDNLPRAPEYFAPGRTMASADASDKASGSIRAEGAGADKIRIFVKRGGRWAYLGPADRLSAAEVRAGVTLGIDARDIIRDRAVWDGKVTLRYAVADGGTETADSVAMHVAPVVLHNHLEAAQDIVSVTPGISDAQPQFLADLKGALVNSGFTRPLIAIETRDTWAQDFVEFGHLTMPAPGGRMTSIRVAIRSPQPGRAAGRLLFDLRGPGMGAVQMGGDGYHQVDSFGNVETVPPYSYKGVSYPAGRVIYGDAGDGVAPHKDMIRFFDAQAVQAPIVLDTSWLAIGHVDEFVQFVPADNARGWTIAVKDVAAALDILRAAQRGGHGGTRAFSREDSPDQTIDQLLGDAELLRLNEAARRRIALNLELLKAETGVTDDEIIRVPGLFHDAEFHKYVRKADGKAPEIAADPITERNGLTFPDEEIIYSPGTLLGYYPASVNGLIVNRHNYVSPRQWGPVIDGVDIMEAGVKAAYARVGIHVWPIDDWLSHHQIAGEVHCGTNAIRAIDRPWWR